MKKKVLVIGDIAIVAHIGIEKNNKITYTQKGQKSKVLGGSAHISKILNDYDCHVSQAGVISTTHASREVVKMLKTMDINTKMLIKDPKCDVFTCTYNKEKDGDFSVNNPRTTEAMISQLSNTVFPKLHLLYAVVVSLCNHQKPQSNAYQKLMISIVAKHPKCFLESHKAKIFTKSFSPIYRNQYLKSMTHAYCLKLNRNEAECLLGCTLNSKLKKYHALLKLKNDFLIKYPIITLDKDGIVFLNNKNQIIALPTQSKNIQNTIGSGEVFFATLIALLMKNNDINQKTFQSALQNKGFYNEKYWIL